MRLDKHPILRENPRHVKGFVGEFQNRSNFMVGEVGIKRLLILGTALLLVALSVPATAVEWNFYGSARFATWYQSGKAAGLYIENDNGSLERDSELVWNLAANSRIGANVRFKHISARFEYGRDPNLRHLYAKWKPHGEKGLELLVGQTFTPISDIFYSDQVYFADENFLAEGLFYSSRKPLIQLIYKGFELAFIKVTGDNDKGFLYPNPDGVFEAVGGTGDRADVDVLFPKIEAVYHYDGNQFFFDVYGGYQTFGIKDPNGGGSGINIQSYAVGGGGGVTLGPAYLRAQANYGQNWGDYDTYSHDLKFWGIPATRGPVPALASQASKSVLTLNTDAAGNPSYNTEDTTSFGVIGVLGYKLNDMFNFEGGVAYLQHDNDFFINDAKVTTYYLNSTVTLAKGVFVVPEFGYFDLHDRLDENRSADDFWYAGAKWQINF